ncbi:MAG TPA: c-type cytochrome [Gemmatimonadaceae bacterium]|nr:c-type cytochrome [Gemmatimonadaceae bacterium]
MMHPSRFLAGAGRLARIALRLSISLRAPRTRRAAITLTMLVGVTTSAAACSARDADAARRYLHTADTVAAAPAAHAPAASEGRSTPTVASRAVVATAADTLLASADVYAGWRTFNVNCQSCHGFNAVASEAAPDLRNSVRQGGTLTRAQFHEVVRKGRMAKGMPAWGALLDAKQIDQIYAYLRARSTGALGAGQPNVGGE